MTNYKLKISYDGTRYFGWERQPGKDTIQGKLEDVLRRMCHRDDIDVIGAGRTDAGVHARAMTANVFLDSFGDTDDIRDYLNRYLPDDIAVSEVKAVSERFHSRYMAKGKIYQYTCFDGKVRPVFNRKYYTPLDEPLDVDAMMEGASFIIGQQDFKSFCGNPKMKKSTVRRIDSVVIRRSKGYVYLTFEGSGFLQYMVRIMTGTLLEVGYHKRSPESIKDIILAKDRSLAGPAAPAKGLCLIKVKY